MSLVLFESLESRSLLSVSSPIPYPGAGPAATPAIMMSPLSTAAVVKAPTATLAAKPITSATSTYSFKVTYKSSVGINLTTLATGNATISGPNGFSQTAALAATAPSANEKSVVATYSVTPPNGTAFTFNANGLYLVSLAANSVTDVNGTAVVGKTLGSFKVQITVAPPPTASLSAKPITAVATAYSFKVTYHSAAEVVASSLASGNLAVTGPNGYTATPTLVSITPAANAKLIVAVYSVAPPGGTFTSSANGTYVVSLVGGSVTDINNRTAVAKVIGTFKTNIKVVPAPVATLSAPALTSSAASDTFTVTYTDKAKVNTASIATGNLTLTGPRGYTSTPALVSIAPSVSAANIVATYSITPATGTEFGSANNGSYTVLLNPASVTNLHKGTNALAVNLGTLQIQIPSTGGGPTAILSASNVNMTGPSAVFSVTFQDTVNITAASLATGNILVTAPGGVAVAATLLAATPGADAKSIVARYSVAPPSSTTFTAADNGTYTVTLAASSVRDANNATNTSPAALGTFAVQIPTTAGPSATLTADNVTAAAASNTFTVTYQDTASINVSTIATGNVTVTGPGGYSSTATLMSTTPTTNSTIIVATYSMAPASGNQFTSASNGNYTVNLNAGAVTDVNSQTNTAAVALGTFGMLIPSTGTVPTAMLSASTVTSATNSDTFTVTYAGSADINVSTIATGNVTVTGPNGYSSVATLVSTTPTSNAASIVATYSIAPTAGGQFTSASNGTYTVTQAAGSVKDINGLTSTATASLGTFAMNISATTNSLPNMVANYNGTMSIPAVGHYRSIAMSITSEDAGGNFTGTWTADGIVSLSISGTVATDGTFTFNFTTPQNTPHAAGPISGTGTGTGGGTGALAFTFTATASGFSAPGTMNLTKG